MITLKEDLERKGNNEFCFKVFRNDNGEWTGHWLFGWSDAYMDSFTKRSRWRFGYIRPPVNGFTNGDIIWIQYPREVNPATFRDRDEAVRWYVANIFQESSSFIADLKSI